MKITGVSFEKKVLTGQWEHELLKVEAVLADGENNPGARVKELVEFVKTRGETAINSDAPLVTTTVKVEGAGAKTETAAVVTPLKKEKKTKATEAKAEEKQAAAPAEEKEETQVEESEQQSEEKTEPEVTKEQEAPKKNFKVKKVTPYNRSNETHKKLLGEFLDKSFPEWRKTPGRYVDASKKLEGSDFLNDEGVIVDDFVAKFKSEVG